MLKIKYQLILLISILLISCTSNRNTIGYTNGFKNNHNGINQFILNEKNGTIKVDKFIPTTQIQQIHFSVLNSKGSKMYLCGRQNKNGRLSSIQFKNNTFNIDSSFITPQKLPCHISLDKEEKYLITCGYIDGTINSWKINEDNTIHPKPIDEEKIKAKSIHPKRQTKAHLHSSFFSKDNNFLFACDLGGDQVLIYNFNKGQLTKKSIYKTTLGGGPRHLALSKDNKYVYILNELSSQIEVCAFNSQEGNMYKLQLISTLPTTFKGNNTTAEILIHPNGKFLYASNRGHDSIAIYSISPKNGTLTFIERQTTLGKRPRNFNITPSGKVMVVGNRTSKQLVSFAINQKNGKLRFLKTTPWDCEIMRIVFK